MLQENDWWEPLSMFCAEMNIFPLVGDLCVVLLVPEAPPPNVLIQLQALCPHPIETIAAPHPYIMHYIFSKIRRTNLKSNFTLQKNFGSNTVSITKILGIEKTDKVWDEIRSFLMTKFKLDLVLDFDEISKESIDSLKKKLNGASSFDDVIAAIE